MLALLRPAAISSNPSWSRGSGHGGGVLDAPRNVSARREPIAQALAPAELQQMGSPEVAAHRRVPAATDAPK
jgi:hypothetical protein